MINWCFDIKDNGNVGYYCENGDYPVTGEMSFYDAKRLLPLKDVRISDKHPGYPLTMDGVFFFAGFAENVALERTQNGAELGADGLPILVSAE
jgi:hypothetical protein